MQYSNSIARSLNKEISRALAHPTAVQKFLHARNNRKNLVKQETDQRQTWADQFKEKKGDEERNSLTD